ncbi:MAG: hypothetical protein K1X83_10260 [Oligoflexia bacterium]|nr:hypothetical protein [Oligoflexia bacterium]
MGKQRKFVTRVRYLDQNGATLVEYALLLGLIAGAVMIGLPDFTGSVNTTLENASNSFGPGPSLGSGNNDGGGGPGDAPENPGGEGPCFLAGTLIEMADGSFTPIEEIKVGDIVRGFNDKDGKFGAYPVVRLFVHPNINGYMLVNDELKVTSNHAFFAHGEWVQLKKLSVGDLLTNREGKPTPLRSIKQIDEIVTTYNFEVDTVHTYVAGGYVVHNANK